MAAAGFAAAPGLAFVPAFGADLDVVAVLRGPLARGVLLAVILLLLPTFPLYATEGEEERGRRPRYTYARARLTYRRHAMPARAAFDKCELWHPRQDSNLRPSDEKSARPFSGASGVA